MESYENRYVYHITHIKNLESIIRYGLLSTNMQKSMGISHVNIANASIQETRSAMEVPCGKRGTIHDYVPFYFASRTPMLLGVINKKNCDQPLLIYLCLKMNIIDKGNVVFTDTSANTHKPPTFYNDKRYLDNLDWAIIDDKSWSFPDDDERHRHMAELLVRDRVDISEIGCIVVFNEKIKECVIDIFNKLNSTPPEIGYDGFNGHYFWFTKFSNPKRKYEQLVTGPVSLMNRFVKSQKFLKKKMQNRKKDCRYKNVEDCVKNISELANVIDYLQPMSTITLDYGIQKGKTILQHSMEVVDCLKKQDSFAQYSDDIKNLLILGALLHDVGKIRDVKPNTAINRNLDHPVDSLIYACCFVYNEILDISEEEIRKLLMIVAYHDIIGDCLVNGRDWEQIVNIINDEVDYQMLVSIGRADIETNCQYYLSVIDNELRVLSDKVLKSKNLQI